MKWIRIPCAAIRESLDGIPDEQGRVEASAQAQQSHAACAYLHQDLFADAENAQSLSELPNDCTEAPN